MANNFPWDDKNFISEYWLRNYRAVQKIIFDCECVQELKIFFSANQVLYYGHMALVKLKELFVTTDHKKYASDNTLCLEFQTEANFFIFSFLQIVTPYREIIKESSCFTEDEITHYFIKNSQADFFRSLRNFQTHRAIPVFPWQVHKNFATGATYLDIHTSKQLVDSIVDYAESDQNKYKSFQSGGLDFLNENKQTPIYNLENDFFSFLFSIHKTFYDRLISTYGSDLDECEHYLKRGENYFISCRNIALKFIKSELPEHSRDTEQNRFPYLFKYLGGVPHFTPQCPEKIFGDHAEEQEKKPCKN